MNARIIRVGVIVILILRRILLIIKVLTTIRPDLTILSYITSTTTNGVTFLPWSTLPTDPMSPSSITPPDSSMDLFSPTTLVLKCPPLWSITRSHVLLTHTATFCGSTCCCPTCCRLCCAARPEETICLLGSWIIAPITQTTGFVLLVSPHVALGPWAPARASSSLSCKKICSWEEVSLKPADGPWSGEIISKLVSRPVKLIIQFFQNT